MTFWHVDNIANLSRDFLVGLIFNCNYGILVYYYIIEDDVILIELTISIISHVFHKVILYMYGHGP